MTWAMAAPTTPKRQVNIRIGSSAMFARSPVTVENGVLVSLNPLKTPCIARDSSTAGAPRDLTTRYRSAGIIIGEPCLTPMMRSSGLPAATRNTAWSRPRNAPTISADVTDGTNLLLHLPTPTPAAAAFLSSVVRTAAVETSAPLVSAESTPTTCCFSGSATAAALAPWPLASWPSSLSSSAPAAPLLRMASSSATKEVVTLTSG
ncbi:Os01g0919150 [Oryza sativa Japonica Group]|uniref:Os01g0919150 protein n=1 Tax=Oryza sativa subsp. japonica TaxID=39947 RepID=A0A0P0VCA0_ORYSJ|nr:hypothetical protein EE612_007588 [Oryza sativa]BAS75912.1 Os01g0919150 [Oryza sativa Japonica Group]